MWEKAADGKTASSIVAELERRLHQIADRPVVRADYQQSFVRRPVVLRQRRLGIKGVDVARRAVHEQKNGMLGLGWKVRRFGRKRITAGRVRIALEQINQGQAGEPAA